VFPRVGTGDFLCRVFCFAQYSVLLTPARVKLGSKGPERRTVTLRCRENPAYLCWIEGADERTRTADLLITSELLYLLSYVGLFRAQSIS
jgi:hypothetical protein